MNEHFLLPETLGLHTEQPGQDVSEEARLGLGPLGDVCAPASPRTSLSSLGLPAESSGLPPRGGAA